MSAVRRLSVIDHTAEFLREKLRQGKWGERLPGLRPLSTELGVSIPTLRAALLRLETEGLLAKGAPGEPHAVVRSPGKKSTRPGLRVGILPYGKLHYGSAVIQRQFTLLFHELEEAGHTPFYAQKTQAELKGDPARILASVRSQKADVWIVLTAFGEVLRALLTLPVPVFDFAGHRGSLEIASTSTWLAPAIRSCVRHLTGLGHRRIVMVCSPQLRDPARFRQLPFIEELEAAGIPAGEYNLPAWDYSAEGLHALLRSLFLVTPPTAIIADDSRVGCAVLAFAAERGLRIPRDLSVVVGFPVTDMAWMRPKPASFVPELDRVNARILAWVNACVTGSQDRDNLRFDAVFDPGETLAPPKS